MKRVKKSPLWFEKNNLMEVKIDLQQRGVKFWREDNTFYFHLQTALFVSAAWILIIIAFSLVK